MKKLLLMLFALITTGAWAQTDVTSQYLTNADFSTTEPITGTYLYGYGKDGTPYGFQTVDGWTSVVTNGDNSNSSYPNSGTAAAVFSYGSSTQLKGNSKAAPATNPAGEASGNCFGFFGVWGCGGYYYQNVTLAAGKYTITIPMYNQSGTQANTTYTGFFPTSGTNQTVAVNPTVGQWVNQTVTFTLTDETEGQIRIGYQSTGSGSGANPMLFIDCVKIEYTAQVVRDILETALASATNINSRINNNNLATAITTAQAVYDDADATQDEVNNAATTLDTAVETAMADHITNGGDATLALADADLSSLDGWTVASTSGFNDKGNGLIGTYNVRFSAATVDDTHLATEYCFGFEARWSGNFASYNQTTVSLPAGVYTLTYDVENVNGSTSNLTYADYNFVEVGGTKNYSSTTEWMQAKSGWTTHTINVTLEEPAPLTISFGYGTGDNNPSADVTPALYVSHVKLTWTSFLDGVKQLWDEAKAAAEEAIANEDYENVTGSEKTALQAEIDKTEPTTAEGYEEATAALQEATAAFTAAKDSYDAFVNMANSDYITTLPYATEEKRQQLDDACNVEPTSAADAEEKTAAITTALRAYYESNAAAEGVEGALNMTERVAAGNADTNTGWTNGIGTNQGQGYTNAAGEIASKYLDGGWASNAGVNIDMTRSVEIPAGKYLLTVTARGAEDLDVYTLSIGGETINLPHHGGNGGVFGNGWDDASVEFETDGSVQTLEVKATSTAAQQWMSINRFRLVRLELYTEMATAEDYAALAAAITAAEAKTLGFDAGEYAPYNNVEVIKAIATAKTIDSSAENEKAEVQALTETLTNGWVANTEEVNAVYDGTLANAPIQATSENVVLPGWVTKSGNTRQTFKGTGEDGKACLADAIDGVGLFVHPGTYNYGETFGYTMPLKADQKYLAEAKYCAWADGSNNDFTLTILKDGATIATKNYGKNATACTEGGALKHVKLYFDVEEAGDYVLSVIANGNTFMTDFIIKKAVAENITLNETEAYTAVTEDTYANVTMNRKVVAGINAVAVPFDLTADQVKAVFGEDAQVYTFEDVADGENSTINFNTKEANTIEANIPVLVGGATASNTQTINGVILKAGEARVAGTNFDFVGNYAGTVQVAEGDYFISGGKLYKSAGTTNLKSFRAFIQNKTNTEGNVKLCIDGVATSINEIVNGQSSMVNGNIYNLAGQRVSKTTRGIYVKNGKKVVVK